MSEDDAALRREEVWYVAGGRYGHRVYRRPDGSGWDEYWGTRAGDWGTRVFGSLIEAERWVHTRPATTKPARSSG